MTDQQNAGEPGTPPPVTSKPGDQVTTPAFSDKTPAPPIIIQNRKSAWEYTFEFLMLFLAVFMGFVAENVRENFEEKKKEREYIRSLIVDLQTDTTMIGVNRPKLALQIKAFDTIQSLLTSDLSKKDSTMFNIYYYSSFLQVSFSVNFNERTITQLLSSGNMRLIKRKNVADVIAGYFNLVKDVDGQKEIYLEHMTKCLESMFDVYDISFLKQRANENDSLVFVKQDWSDLKLLSKKPEDIRKLTTTIEITKLVSHGYGKYLDLIKENCDLIIDFLREEYGIDD
jgi:hypothetical protein